MTRGGCRCSPSSGSSSSVWRESPEGAGSSRLSDLRDSTSLTSFSSSRTNSAVGSSAISSSSTLALSISEILGSFPEADTATGVSNGVAASRASIADAWLRDPFESTPVRSSDTATNSPSSADLSTTSFMVPVSNNGASDSVPRPMMGASSNSDASNASSSKSDSWKSSSVESSD